MNPSTDEKKIWFMIRKTPNSKLWLQGRKGTAWVWVVNRNHAGRYSRQAASETLKELRKAHYPNVCVVQCLPPHREKPTEKSEEEEEVTLPKAHRSLIDINVKVRHLKKLGGNVASDGHTPVDTLIRLHAYNKQELLKKIDALQAIILGLEMPTCTGGVILLGLRHQDEE